MTPTPDDSIVVPRGGVPWVFASTISFTLAGALFYLYLARVVPLGELGAVVILSAVAWILPTVTTLGLGRGFTHFLSYHQARGDAPVTRTFLGMSFVTTALLALAAVGLAVALSSELSELLFHSSHYTSTLQLLGLYSGLLTAGMILSGVLLGLQRYVGYSVVNILGAVGMYTIPIALFALWPNVQSIVFGWILGALLEVVSSVAVIQRVTRVVRSSQDRLTVSPGTLYRGLFAYSIPVLASLLITTGTYYIDRLVLASIANLATVGVYNYAILFASASLFVVAPFTSILTPQISAYFGRGERTQIRNIVRTSNVLVILAFVPMALALAALGPFLLRYIVGAAFVGASAPMALLLVISAVFIPVTNLISLASGIRRTSILMVSSSCALVANAALSVALVPHFGMLGAALGNSAMFWAPCLVLYFVLQDTGLVQFDLRSIARIWAAATAMALTIAAPLIYVHYAPIFVPLVVAVGVVVFLASLRLLRALPREATDELNRHLPHWASALRPLICWAAACNDCHHDEDRDRLVSPVTAERR